MRYKSTKKKTDRPKRHLVCKVCGLLITVDNVCGCVDTCDIICCGQQMDPKNRIRKLNL